MKINFLNFNSGTEAIPAESNTTSVAPTDYVGELRISRMRISKGCFPLMYVPISTHSFNANEQSQLTAASLIPTDIAYGFYLPIFNPKDMTGQPITTVNNKISPINNVGYWYKRIDTQSESSGTKTITGSLTTTSNLQLDSYNSLLHEQNMGLTTQDAPTASYVQQKLLQSMHGRAGGGGASSDELAIDTITYNSTPFDSRIQLTLQGSLGWGDTAISGRTTTPVNLTINESTTQPFRYIYRQDGSIFNATTASGGLYNAQSPITRFDDRNISGLQCYMFYLHGTPRWRSDGTLANEGKYIYSWDLFKELGEWRLITPVGKVYNLMDPVQPITPAFTWGRAPKLSLISNKDDELEFRLQAHISDVHSDIDIGTPAIFLSTVFANLLKVDGVTCNLAYDFMRNQFPGYYYQQHDLPLTFPDCELKYDNLPLTCSYQDGLDFSSTFKIKIRTEDLNPTLNLLVATPDLTFKGEQISVNTPAIQGVTSPSFIPVLRSFYIGFTDKERSDFVFYEDLLTTSCVIVNNPRQARLKLEVYMITKKNEMIKMSIPPGEDIQIQLLLA